MGDDRKRKSFFDDDTEDTASPFDELLRDEPGDAGPEGSILDADPSLLKQLGIDALGVLAKVGRGASQASGLTAVKAAITGQNPLETLSKGQAIGGAIGGVVGGIAGEGIGAIPGAAAGSFIGSLFDPGKIEDVPASQITGTDNLFANFALDVALDPATYATFGVKAVGKVAEEAAARGAARAAGSAVRVGAMPFEEVMARAGAAGEAAAARTKVPGLGFRVPGTGFLTKTKTAPTFVVPGSRAAAKLFDDNAALLASKMGKAIEGSSLNPVKVEGKFLSPEASKLRRAFIELGPQDSLGKKIAEDDFQHALNTGRDFFKPTTEQAAEKVARLEEAAARVGIADPATFLSSEASTLRNLGRGTPIGRTVDLFKGALQQVGRAFGSVKGLPAEAYDMVWDAQGKMAFETMRLIQDEVEPILKGLSPTEKEMIVTTLDRYGATANAIHAKYNMLEESARKGIPIAIPGITPDGSNIQAVRDAMQAELKRSFVDTVEDVMNRNPRVGDALNRTKLLMERLGTLDRAAGVLDKSDEFYLSHIVRNLRTNEVATQGTKTLRRTLGGMQTAREADEFGRWRYPTIEALKAAGYDPETDLGRILMARVAASVKARGTRQLYEDVGRTFGRPAKELARETVSTSSTLKHVLDNALEASSNVVPRGGAAHLDDLAAAHGLTSIPVSSLPITENFVRVEGVPELETLVLPREVAQIVADVATEAPPRALSNVLRMYDMFQGYFKSAVTVFFPSFHARNAASNFINSAYQVGVIPALNPFQHLNAVQLLKRDGAGHFVNDFAIDLGMGGIEKMSETRRLLGEAGLFRKVGGKLDIDPGFFDPLKEPGTVRKLFQKPAAFGQWIEEEARVNLYYAARRQGMPPADAIDVVRRQLFDYARFTPFEKNVMKRLIPFYSWSRRNIPLQFQQILQTPGLATSWLSAWNDLGPNERERARLPGYLKDSLLLRTGVTEDGNLHFVSNLDVPVRDAFTFIDSGGLTRAVEKNVLGALSPILRLPLEIATGHSFYTGREIIPRQNAQGFDKLFAEVPGLREWLDTKEEPGGKLTVDGPRLYAIKGWGLGRAFSLMNRSANPDVETWWKVMDFFTGLNPKTQSLLWEDRARLLEIQDSLYRKGELHRSIDYGKPTTARAAIVARVARQAQRR